MTSSHHQWHVMIHRNWYDVVKFEISFEDNDSDYDDDDDGGGACVRVCAFVFAWLRVVLFYKQSERT